MNTPTYIEPVTQHTDYPFVTSGSYPTRAGNNVRLLIDGEPAFRRICEAIEAAQHSVWATVTFMWPAFVMPDGRGKPLELFAKAAARGVDVRLIFWRPDSQTAYYYPNAFWGAPEHLEQLQALATPVNVRWDCAHPGYCQHQKSWVIDGGTPGEVAFVGGINMNPHSMVAPSHHGESQNHDVYLELSGPAVADVRHNFVQRWNEASERNAEVNHWGPDAAYDLPFPEEVMPERCQAVVQVQRTIHAGLYQDGHAPVGGQAFDIAAGERTNLEQYCLAIRSARRAVYIENQYLDVLEIIQALHDALSRGVEVVALVPGVPVLMGEGETTPEGRTFFEARDALGNYDTFTLSALMGVDAEGRRTPTYVHSKLMLVDDAWATVGSANLHHWSLFGNAELNVAVLSPELVRAFRVELFREFLGEDTSELDDVAALRRFREVATENRQKLAQDDHNWRGLTFALDVATYGREPQTEADGGHRSRSHRQ